MAAPLMVLALASMFIGYFSKDMFIGLGTDFYQNSITILPSHLLYVDSEFLPVHIKLLPLFFTLTGATLGFTIYHTNIEALSSRLLFTFLGQK
jgi:NADH-ubiquinone oxidoreductase chain 5